MTFPIEQRKWHDGIVRVLVGDEFSPFRRQTVVSLEQAADIEVLGEAPDGDVARTVAEQMAPDVVILGVHLPPTDGIRAASVLRELVPNIEIALMIDLDDSDSDVARARRAVRAGVTGFVSRDAQPTELIGVVRALSAGRPVLPAAVAGAVLDDFDSIGPDEADRSVRVPEIDARARDLLERVSAGDSISAAAEHLGLSAVTASNVVAGALRTLHRHARLAGGTTGAGASP